MHTRTYIGVTGFCLFGLLATQLFSDDAPDGQPAVNYGSPGVTPSPLEVPLELPPVDDEAREVMDDLAGAVMGQEVSLAATVQGSSVSPLSLDALRTALEDSMYGHLDPSVFLDMALALTELEVGEDALEQRANSAVRYPIVGMPEGMEGEYWVCSTRNPEFSTVRKYALSCRAPGSDYYVEGAGRSLLQAKIGVWTDLDGRVTNFSVTTQMHVSAEHIRSGFPREGVPEGFHYAYDVNNPHEFSSYLIGVSNGTPTRLDDRPTFVDTTALPVDDLERLSAGMLAVR